MALAKHAAWLAGWVVMVFVALRVFDATLMLTDDWPTWLQAAYLTAWLAVTYVYLGALAAILMGALDSIRR